MKKIASFEVDHTKLEKGLYEIVKITLQILFAQFSYEALSKE